MPRTLKVFYEQHAEAEIVIKTWQKTMQKNNFANLHELQETFPGADLVKAKDDIPVIVFNVGGNSYRIIGNLNWQYKSIFIKCVFTHAEYDEWNKKGRPL